MCKIQGAKPEEWEYTIYFKTFNLIQPSQFQTEDFATKVLCRPTNYNLKPIREPCFGIHSVHLQQWLELAEIDISNFCSQPEVHPSLDTQL